MKKEGELVLVEKAKNGDIKAFETLMEMTSGKIYNLGLRLMRNREDAADIMQETYMKAYERLADFKGKAAFSTWLYRIATNFALMKLRKEKGRQVSPVELKDASGAVYEKEISDWSANPAAYLKNKDLREILEGAIKSLPPKYKAVFILRDIEGLPIASVAETLALSEAAVKTRAHRSRMYLREKLSEYFKTSKAGHTARVLRKTG